MNYGSDCASPEGRDELDLLRQSTEQVMTLAAGDLAAGDLAATDSGARHVAARSVEVIPTGAALGAEVRGVDLKVLDDAAFAGVMQAWHDHSVLLIRGQTLDDQDLIAFSSRLGDLDWAPVQETGRRF